MNAKLFYIGALLMLQFMSAYEAFLVVPEDVGTAFAAIYGFTPRIVIGRDHRFGFGFQFGNHADLQLVYELGPQTSTRAFAANTKARSAAGPQRARRRPFLELLLRAGVLLDRNQSDRNKL